MVRDKGAELLCPTRKLWREGDGSTLDSEGEEIKVKLLPKSRVGDLVYDQDGQVYCAYQPQRDKPWDWRPMVFKGYEADRLAVKYVCPARAYGIECPSVQDCRRGYSTQVRVKLEDEPRIFVPTPRHSPKFQRSYNPRTSVERVNGALDTVFGFELHTMRGLAMTRLRVGLALCAMLSMAAGRIKVNQRERMGSIVAPVPRHAAAAPEEERRAAA
jgi:hypothetical protein